MTVTAAMLHNAFEEAMYVFDLCNRDPPSAAARSKSIIGGTNMLSPISALRAFSEAVPANAAGLVFTEDGPAMLYVGPLAEERGRSMA